MQTGMLAAPSQRSGGSSFKTTGSLPWCEKASQAFYNSYVGAMRITEAGFEYWIGVFMAPEAPVPQGYEAVEIPAGDLGVCFLYGKDSSPDLFGMDAHKSLCRRLAGAGLDSSGWFLERYNCPRYTVPDEKGNVILDYCAYLLPFQGIGEHTHASGKSQKKKYRFSHYEGLFRNLDPQAALGGCHRLPLTENGLP